MLLWFCGAHLLLLLLLGSLRRLYTMAREGQEGVLFLPRAEQGVPTQNHTCNLSCMCVPIYTVYMRHSVRLTRGTLKARPCGFFQRLERKWPCFRHEVFREERKDNRAPPTTAVASRASNRNRSF